VASPDFRQFVDLTIFDEQPRDIYLDAIDYAREALPEFVTRQGTVEDAVLQATSFIAAQTIAAINRLPNGLMEGILRLLGFDRVEAAFATGTVYFTTINTQGLNIPTGTKIAYSEQINGGVVQHLFTTTEGAFIPEGEQQSNPVAFRADVAGVKPPLLTGQEMTILTASNSLLEAFLDTDLVQGGAGESDPEYFTRGVNYIQSLTSGLVTAPQITGYILSTYPNAFRVLVQDLTRARQIPVISLERSNDTVTAVVQAEYSSDPTLYDPEPVGFQEDATIRLLGFIPETFNGNFTLESVIEDEENETVELTWSQLGSNASATPQGIIMPLDDISIAPSSRYTGSYAVSVLDRDMRLLSNNEKETILEDLNRRSVAGMRIQVLDALLLPLEVSVIISVQRGFSDVTVEQSVKQFIEEQLSPNRAPWQQVIRRNTLISDISCNVEGVASVRSVTFFLNPNERLAVLNEGTGDIGVLYRGVLPVAQAVVTIAND